MPLPRPPVNNMTEFVVFVFVTIVAIMLIGTTTAAIIFAFVNKGADQGAIFNTLTDILTTIIGALIGYIAGKGQGKAEAQEEHARRVEEAERVRDEA